MTFQSFSSQQQPVKLLQRSLEQGRLGHAYLFQGDRLESLEQIARTLAQTLECQDPVLGKNGRAIDCCDACRNCRRIGDNNHPDVHWLRPESKLRVIVMEQIRDLIATVNLKPAEARHKIAVIVAADRLSVHTANAFLKTLEEPSPNSVLILLTTEPHRMLETVVSRCLRLSFSGEATQELEPDIRQWLTDFADRSASDQKSLLGRYCLMDILLRKLAELRSAIDENLKARSPLERYEDADKELRDRWEDELVAAVEAEYRRQRSELLLVLETWLRDIWLGTLQLRQGIEPAASLGFRDIPATAKVADRLASADALENLTIFEQLQRRLATNVQEALAIEVAFLKLHF